MALKILKRLLSLLLIFGIAWGAYWGGTKLFSKNKSFPKLAEGHYRGDLVLESQNYPFYLQTLNAQAQIIVYLVKPDFKPLILSLDELKTDRADDLRPLPLMINDKQFVLFGKTSGDRLSGKIELANSELVVGSWSLEKIAGSNFGNSFNSEKPSERIVSLFKFQISDSNLKKSDQRLESAKEKHKTLKHYLSDEEALRNKGNQELKELQENLDLQETDRRAKIREVNDLSEQLKTSARVTMEGRSISLARRIASREAKWFFANWQEPEDQQLANFSGSEEMEGIDDFASAYKEAEEKSRILREIKIEKIRLRNLENRMAGKGGSSSPKVTMGDGDSQGAESPKAEKSFMEKVLGW